MQHQPKLRLFWVFSIRTKYEMVILYHSRKGENARKLESRRDAMAQWRRFAFFDKEVLKDANGPWMKVRVCSTCCTNFVLQRPL